MLKWGEGQSFWNSRTTLSINVRCYDGAKEDSLCAGPTVRMTLPILPNLAANSTSRIFLVHVQLEIPNDRNSHEIWKVAVKCKSFLGGHCGNQLWQLRRPIHEPPRYWMVLDAVAPLPSQGLCLLHLPQCVMPQSLVTVSLIFWLPNHHTWTSLTFVEARSVY